MTIPTEAQGAMQKACREDLSARTIKPGDKLAYRKEPLTEIEWRLWDDGSIVSRNSDGVVKKHHEDGLSRSGIAHWDLVPLQARVEGEFTPSSVGPGLWCGPYIEGLPIGKSVHLRQVMEGDEQ